MAPSEFGLDDVSIMQFVANPDAEISAGTIGLRVGVLVAVKPFGRSIAGNVVVAVLGHQLGVHLQGHRGRLHVLFGAILLLLLLLKLLLFLQQMLRQKLHFAIHRDLILVHRQSVESVDLKANLIEIGRGQLDVGGCSMVRGLVVLDGSEWIGLGGNKWLRVAVDSVKSLCSAL